MKNKFTWSAFWKAAAIRAVRTMAQAAVGFIGTNAMGLADVDWIGTASGVALMGIVSILMSIATGLPEVPEEGN